MKGLQDVYIIFFDIGSLCMFVSCPFLSPALPNNTNNANDDATASARL